MKKSVRAATRRRCAATSVFVLAVVLSLLPLARARASSAADLSQLVKREAGKTERFESPSGQFVALRRDEGGAVRIVIVDAASGRELTLPGRLPIAELPRWAPVGERLAVALRIGKRTEVFLLDLEGGDGPRLYRLTFGGGRAPRWIVGGKRLIYQASDGRGGSILMERDQRGNGPARPFWRRERRRTPPPRGPIT